MKIVFKHILRNIKEHKMRSFLIFFSLLVSTSVFVVSLTISDDLTIKVEDTLRKVYGNAEVSVSTVDPFSVDDLNKNDEEFYYVGFNFLDGLDKDEKPVMLYGCDYNRAIEFKMIGEDAKPLESNELYISKKLAEEKNYKIGDIVNIKYKDNNYEFTIKNIIENKGIASLKPQDDLFFASIEAINNIRSIEKDHYDSIFFDIKDNDKIGEFVDYLKDNNENYNIAKTVDMEAIKDATSMISTMMFLILLMATIMIFFVISSLNKIILAERIPVIGTFRSVGASRSKMNLILILENAIYGVVAGFFGAIFGTLLDSSFSNAFIVADGVDVSQSSVSISIGTIIVGILFAVALQVFITFREIIRTNKKPIKDLIFNTQNTRYRLRKRRTIIGFVFLVVSMIVLLLSTKLSTLTVGLCLIIFIVGVANTLPFFFQIISKGLTALFKKIGWSTGIVSSKNIGYNKRIISSSRLIVIAISILSSIIMMSYAVANAFENFRVVTKNVDLIVEGPSYSSENYKYLFDIEGVKDVQFLNSYFPEEVTYNDNKAFAIPPGFYAEEERKNVYIEEIDYKIKDLKEGEILVDEKYAFKNGFEIGDELTINFGTLNKSFTYKIVGYVDASNFNVSRNLIVVTYNHLINDLNGVPLQIHLVLDNKEDAENMKDTIKDSIKEVGISVKTTEEYITEQEAQTEGIISIIYIVIGISVTLAFVGVINNQIINFISRRKELAVLNSTCMNRSQIISMLAFETLIANFISLFISVLVTYITTVFVNNFLINIGLYLNVKFNLMVALRFAFIVYIILLLTLLVPIKKLRKMNIVEEIKYE